MQIFENKSVFYSVKDKNFFKGKKVCIFGGGDSALDWAIELSKFAEITLVHRRKEFRGAGHSTETVKKLEKEGKLKIKTPFQINSIEGKEKIMSQINFFKNKENRTGGILCIESIRFELLANNDIFQEKEKIRYLW